MIKNIILFLFIWALLTFNGFAQEKSGTVIVNKQVEVVEYDYDYIFIEFQTTVSLSTFYPFYTRRGHSERQQFFEQGQNARMGFDMGINQSVKMGEWSFSTGLSFQRYNEFFSYNEYSLQPIMIQNETGNVRQVDVAVDAPVLLSRNNNLNYLKIPLCVGYYPSFLKDHIGFNLQGNLHYLLSADYTVKFSTLEAASKLSPTAFNPYFFSLSGGMVFNYHLSDAFSFSVGPNFSLGFDRLISREDLSFGINYLGIDLRFSVSY